MKGVIIYADDDVLNHKSGEFKLFQKFNENCEYSIIPINNIQDLESTILSISTFRALLLDWSFKIESMDPDIPTKHVNPLQFLKTQKIYSIICIYSREEIGEDIKKELIEIYGENKISFQLKTSTFDENEEFNRISELISTIEGNNSHMKIPFIWSQAINQSVQSIFSELENADPNWIKEIRDTANNDGGEPTSEVINIFQNLVNESIIQDETLRNALDTYNCENIVSPEENTAKLYQRIFYSKISDKAPIMTGDIFRFSENEYGILITPECVLCEKNKHKVKDSYEFLIINKDASEEFQKKKRKINTSNPGSENNIFNNGVDSRHILISFPFSENKYDDIALIDFFSAICVCKVRDQKGNHIISNRISYKLNSPYIHQLRQRFNAYFGRYGVPEIPNSLREYNLK